jgi:L-alanine-DL-glutamate epimerase-like enolase superfamily enzyme
MQLYYKTIHTPFRHPFTISGGRTKTHQPSLVVALQMGRHFGYGEAPAISYYNVTVEEMKAVAEAYQQQIEKFAFTEPGRYWHYLHHLLPGHPFLVAALDIAGWDLAGKLAQKPLYALWGTTMAQTPVTNLTIGLDTPDKMLEKMAENPWPVYKIKLGVPGDVALVETLRKKTDAVFRVDANGGWTLAEATEKIPALAAMGVELIEQPLAKDNWDGMKQLYDASPVPLIADESCVSEHDVQKCVGYFHGINIKLTKCSGITPALRMVQEARVAGLRVMMGNMNETTVGTAAIAHFLPQLDYVDADGPLLLQGDVASGLTYRDGYVQVSGEPGLGIRML